jgi:hypothetical protein
MTKWFQRGLIALAVASAAMIVWNAAGYWITLRKIEATCHEALAFKEPTALAKRVCWSHGFYN